MVDITDSIPPVNIEAEEAILGGILLDPEAMARVADTLVKEAFSLQAHQEIYHAAQVLHVQGKPTDLMAVSTYLADRGLLDKVGGITKLGQLLNRTVSAVNIDRYNSLVMEKYARRQLIKAGHEIVDLGYETAKELEIVLDESEQKIFRLTQERPQQGLVAIAETLINAFNTIEDLHQETVLPGIPSGFYDLDGITSGFSRSDLIIIAGRPAMGKCLAAYSELVCADGSIATIEEIYHRRTDSLLTLQDNWKFAWTKPSSYVDDGIKPVFRVTTRLGRSIETTLTHPYLTIQGWKSLGQLQVGDKIAVPRQINSFGQKTISEGQVKILAYLIGDGCLMRNSPLFINSNTRLLDDFSNSVSSNFIGLSCQTLTLWLKELGLWGKNAYNKTIPKLVFTLQRPLISLFLNRLFATNGWVTVLNSGQSQIGYSTMSEQLARQIQHLLLRFGVIASLKSGFVKYKNNRRRTWQLDITDGQSIKNFITEIGIFGKEEAVNAVRETILRKKYHTNRDLIPIEVWQKLEEAKGQEPWSVLAQRSGIKGYRNIHVGQRALSRERLFKLACALENVHLQNLATSDIYWDEIVAIESVGNKQVYDLTIPTTHNFVANDICVHNTSFALNIAANIAKQQNLPTAIFSLEMSREQLAQRMLASEAKISSNRLRSGRISQNEFEPLINAVTSLSELPIFIDDTANLSVMQMRSQVRRLQGKTKQELGLVLLDYLQLMEGSGSDNRVQELSKITRSLKQLAREINAPIIALSQLSRGVEQRTNKRPMLSDLRESGCLDGDTLITLAETGLQVPIKKLAGLSGFTVWALNQTTQTIEKAFVSNAFCTGIKPIFSLKTALGRTIQATANHQFLTIEGWKRLDELEQGNNIAVPTYIPSCQKQTMTDAQLGLLGHLIGDGCTLPRHAIQYTTKEKDLGDLVVVPSEELTNLANSDLYWDKIKSIEFKGESEVYDLTVPVHHNFIANNIVVHNSIEQDADLVMMLYRDEYYNPDTPDRGIAEAIIVKHRNGPVGTVKLLFKGELTKFENLAKPGEY